MFATLIAGAIALAGATGAIAQGKGKINFGFEVPLSIVNVPNFAAVDRLKEMGYEVAIAEFQSPETMTLALQKGDVDIINTSAGTAFSAIDAGFDGKVFLGQSNADFQMVARKDLQTCESLDGKRVAVQSREGTTGVLAARWFANACPTAKPDIMIVPGSENRVAGLIAGQLDASPIDTQNTANLMKQRPGEFDVIDSFSESTKLLASVFVTRSDWLAANKQAAADFAKAYVDAVNKGAAKPDLVLEQTKKLLPDLDPAMLEEVVKGWIARGVWNPVGGVQPETIDAAIAFYSSARPYAKIKTAADVSTAEFVAGLK
jgi:ABC-type nitrate/sulfonate/bicarbonate transport system substrate-binding protein